MEEEEEDIKKKDRRCMDKGETYSLQGEVVKGQLVVSVEIHSCKMEMIQQCNKRGNNKKLARPKSRVE